MQTIPRHTITTSHHTLPHTHTQFTAHTLYHTYIHNAHTMQTKCTRNAHRNAHTEMHIQKRKQTHMHKLHSSMKFNIQFY